MIIEERSHQSILDIFPVIRHVFLNREHVDFASLQQKTSKELTISGYSYVFLKREQKTFYNLHLKTLLVDHFRNQDALQMSNAKEINNVVKINVVLWFVPLQFVFQTHV